MVILDLDLVGELNCTSQFVDFGVVLVPYKYFCDGIQEGGYRSRRELSEART